jgi:hypothetical protein
MDNPRDFDIPALQRRLDRGDIPPDQLAQLILAAFAVYERQPPTRAGWDAMSFILAAAPIMARAYLLDCVFLRFRPTTPQGGPTLPDREQETPNG